MRNRVSIATQNDEIVLVVGATSRERDEMVHFEGRTLLTGGGDLVTAASTSLFVALDDPLSERSRETPGLRDALGMNLLVVCPHPRLVCG